MEILRPVILASGSPRRLEILKAYGIEPIVCPADVDETVSSYVHIREVPERLAEKKAFAVYAKVNTDALIIGADTIVFMGDPEGEGRIMGKPHDAGDGFEMLSALRNNTHYVITGVCVIDSSTGRSKTFSEITEVTFGDYSDEELKAYLDTPEAYDKAGGYAIQGTFGKYVKDYKGSYENVIGFPWDRIEKEIEFL